MNESRLWAFYLVFLNTSATALRAALQAALRARRAAVVRALISARTSRKHGRLPEPRRGPAHAALASARCQSERRRQFQMECNH